VELQAELAYVQARLSILNRISEDPQSSSISPTLHSSLLHHLSSNNETSYMSMHFGHPLQNQYHQTPFENPSYYSYHQQFHDQEFQALPRDF